MTSVALPLDNIDTDQLLPARFLKVPRSQGYGPLLLRDLRFTPDGQPRAGFPLNDPARAGARILVARRAFGVGSSREAAVYALVDFGIRCVVATGYGDIFAGNAVSNGLLAAIVGEEEIERLLAAVEKDGRARVDLEACIISAGEMSLSFVIDPVPAHQAHQRLGRPAADHELQGCDRRLRRHRPPAAAVGDADGASRPP